jgi:acetolactate synthase-1/2/3 large subunit
MHGARDSQQLPASDCSASTSSAMLILQQLHAEGVDYFFANGGTDFPPIAEAFAHASVQNIPVPRPMVIPHENLAVAMAHGVYMVNRRMQAVMLHVNVGSANAINALLDAGRDETPVLLMAGRSPYSEDGRHGTRTRYIHWAQEMFDQASMLREAVKWDYELHLPEQAPNAVARAAQVALSEPRGPVYLTLPRDVIAEDVTGGVPIAPLAFAPAPHPDPAGVHTLATWLAEAKRPLIVTSAAGRTEEGFAALDRFSRTLGVPVESFHPRFLNVATDNPYFAGFEPGKLIAHADLVIALESDVPWVPSVQAPPASARIAHVGIDPTFARYPMRTFRSDLSIAGETKTVLPALELALGARRTSAAAPPRGVPTVPVASNPISPEWISHCVGEAIDEDTILVNEYPLRLPYCPRTKPGTYFGLSAAGGLGWGLPAAIGAKLAAPERLVVATLGDGAYIFANPTACHWAAEAHGLPVLTVIFNNALYGAVRNSTKAMYADGLASRDGYRMLADLQPSPAFEKLVEASGGMGYRVERAEELPAVLAEAIATVRGGRQALVNVICDY